MIEKLLSFLIFLTILLSPLYVVRWKYFGILPTTLLELLIWLTTGVWILAKVISKDFSWPKTKFDAPILLFLTAAVISLFVTPDFRGGLGIFKAYIVEPIVFFYILVETGRKAQGTRHKAQSKTSTFYFLPSTLFLPVAALFLAALWVSLLGILQALFGIGVITPHEAAAGRAHAVYNSGNALALFVGPVLFLGLGQLGSFTGKVQGTRYKIKHFLLLTCYLSAILLSKSTGSLVGLMAALVSLFVISARPACRTGRGGPASGWRYSLFVKFKKVIFLGLLVGFLGGILFFLNISYFTPVVENSWQRTGGTVQVRLCVWEGTRNLLKDKPIFGAGLSGFKELYSQKYYTCDAEPLEYPHNWVLNFWAEMGILGLLGFLWILKVYFEKGIKGVKGVKDKIKLPVTSLRPELRPRGYQLPVSALAVAMIYWLVHGLVDTPYFKNDLALEFWVLVAIAVAVSESALKKEKALA